MQSSGSSSALYGKVLWHPDLVELGTAVGAGLTAETAPFLRGRFSSGDSGQLCHSDSVLIKTVGLLSSTGCKHPHCVCGEACWGPPALLFPVG